MEEPLCITVGDCRVHLDQLAACVTTAEGAALTRPQWIGFAQKLIQLLLSLFTGAPPAPPAEQPAEPQAAPPEATGPPHANRPKPR